jgi:hypothetical protein
MDRGQMKLCMLLGIGMRLAFLLSAQAISACTKVVQIEEAKFSYVSAR